MARQNIDEKWKTDPRRTALANRIGGRNADGMRVEVNWLLLAHKGQPIPLKEFKYVADWQEWVDCGLGEIVDETVRIAGADEYTEFFKKQRSNGSKGGRPKKNPEEPNLTQINPSETQTNPNNPSFSFSFSKKKNNNRQPKVEFKTLESLLAAIPKTTQDNWAKLYPQDFIERELLLAWNFYSVKPPGRLADWSRALGGWLERTTKWAKRDAVKAGIPENGDIGGEYALR